MAEHPLPEEPLPDSQCEDSSDSAVPNKAIESDPPSIDRLERKPSLSSLSGYLASEELSSSSDDSDKKVSSQDIHTEKKKRRKKSLSFLRRRPGTLHFEHNLHLDSKPPQTSLKKKFLRCRFNKILGCRLCKRTLTRMSIEESTVNNQSSCSSKNSSNSHVQFSDHVIVHIYKGDSHPEMEERHIITELDDLPKPAMKASLIKYLLDDGNPDSEAQRESLGELLKRVAAENPSLAHHFSAPDLLDRNFFLKTSDCCTYPKLETNAPRDTMISEVSKSMSHPSEAESEEIILDVNTMDQPKDMPTLKEMSILSTDKMSEESLSQRLQHNLDAGVNISMFNVRGPSRPSDSAGPSQGQERTSYSDSNIPGMQLLLSDDNITFPTKECAVGDVNVKVARSTNLHRDPGRLCVLNEAPCMLTPPSSDTGGEICSASDTRAVLRIKDRPVALCGCSSAGHALAQQTRQEDHESCEEDDDISESSRIRKRFTTNWVKPRDRQR